MLQTCIKNRLIRRGIVALVLLATLPGIPVAAGQTFDEAVAAYGSGWPPSRATLRPNTASGSCTPTARVSSEDDAEAAK